MFSRASLVVLGLASAVLRADVSLPASDPRIRYEGRVDLSAPAAPVLVWSGTRLRVDFEGPKLTLLFASATGQNFFDATIDESRQIISVPASSAPQRIDVPLAARGAGRHRLVLFKRSEAAAGEAVFAGVELAANAHAWEPAIPHYRCRMEFFGDSITAGACDEDGPTDQWDDRRTHNHAQSYATLTAAALEADYRCVAVSGMGIVTGWTDVKASQIWDRLHPRADSPRADLRAWQPDIAFVNFGENDASFPDAHGQPFPVSDFTRGYVAFVTALRSAYPRAHLVLLRGGMLNGAQNPELRRAWDAAVGQLEARDAMIHHFVFSHWSRLHPRVADHRAMADELIAWLRAQPFAASAGCRD
jgi:lysophospholipase L1-like esterase